jgi:hypothetical protein
MKGIPLSPREGVVKESIIKTNYIFTIDPSTVVRKLFSLAEGKQQILCSEMQDKICGI